jgi:putative methyltransferase (TIGR04325 family)
MRLFNLHLAGVYVDIRVSRESHAIGAQQSKAEYAKTHNTFEGDFSSWHEAMKYAKGYDSPLILDRAIAATRAVVNGEAACERDTVLFDKPQIAYPLLAGLLYAASCNDQRLAVMDVGGALGSSYRQNKPFLAQLDAMHWGVVEQENFVRAGQAEFQTESLRFFPDVEACVQALRPNFLLLSSVLQYLEHPYQFLSDLLSRNIPFVFIDRTMAHRFGRDRLAVQRVPPTIYSASYPVWLLDAGRLESVFKDAGYEVLDHFDPHPGSTFGLPDFSAPYAAWFLKKASARR